MSSSNIGLFSKEAWGAPDQRLGSTAAKAEHAAALKDVNAAGATATPDQTARLQAASANLDKVTQEGKMGATYSRLTGKGVPAPAAAARAGVRGFGNGTRQLANIAARNPKTAGVLALAGLIGGGAGLYEHGKSEEKKEANQKIAQAYGGPAYQ